MSKYGKFGINSFKIWWFWWIFFHQISMYGFIHKTLFFTATNLSCFLKVSDTRTRLLCSKVHARSTSVPSFNLKKDHNLWTCTFRDVLNIRFIVPTHKNPFPWTTIQSQTQCSHHTPNWVSSFMCLDQCQPPIGSFNNPWVGIRVGCQITSC